MHRLNNAAHESGMPYQVRRFNSIGVPHNPPQQPIEHMPLQAMSLANSVETANPLEGSAEEIYDAPFHNPELNQSLATSMSAMPSNTQTLPQDATLDMFIYNSNPYPAIQTRYSMNDFSGFLDSEPSDILAQSTMSANIEQGPFCWDDYNVVTPFTLGDVIDQPLPPQTASSIASYDQPSLSRSSSGTLSDAGEFSTLADFSIVAQEETQTPLVYDATWSGGAFPFIPSSNGFSQPVFQPLEASVITYPTAFSDLSSSYVAQQAPVTTDLLPQPDLQKWLQLTPEPLATMVPLQGELNTDMYGAGGSDMTPLSSFLSNSLTSVQADWPAPSTSASTYDFAGYGLGPGGYQVNAGWVGDVSNNGGGMQGITNWM